MSIAPQPDTEVARARQRRTDLQVTRPTPFSSGDLPAQPSEGSQWGLALSGGGIRSATFCLGVTQAMARTPDPAAPADRIGTWPLLLQFDYLSTVSGGGYVGGFLSSLYVPGRLSGDPSEPAEQTVRTAVRALQDEPPARIHSDTEYDPTHPGRAALAWLRDNGRYMAPTGAGDLFYGLTIAVRNWFATQYVVGTLVLLMLAAVQAIRWSVASLWPDYRMLEQRWLLEARLSDSLIWWSPSWALVGVVALLATVPLGIAYWFTHPARGQPWVQQTLQRLNRPAPLHPHRHVAASADDRLAQPPEAWTTASLLGLLVATVLLALGGISGWALSRDNVAAGLLGAGLGTLLAVCWYMVATWLTNHDGLGTITRQRVLLTRWLSRSLMCACGLALLSTIETIGQTAWLWISMREGAILSALLAALIWLIKEGAQRLDDAPPEHPLNRLPIGLVAGVVGGLLWASVAAALDILLLQVAWPQGWANPEVLAQPRLAQQAMAYAWSVLVLCAFLAWVVGRFPGFLNLSTLQSLYSARLIRAYLGASNRARFAPDATPESRDVAEPILGDSLSVDDVHRNALAPQHFVNVCVNQSVSPGEQLVQRDRKGKPLVVAQGGVYFDQQSYAMGCWGESELSQALSFGEWLGVSGAAFSTGLGRGTDLGLSLALGFANVRLGRWWEGLPPQTRALPWRYRHFPTQAYLIDELRGAFYGNHRPYLYLSDGGHFENTAVYELLRLDRPRQVRVIVVCDCGCDPDYQFADLANLTRLVRIDQGLEVRVNAHAIRATLLSQVFAHPDDFRRRPDGTLPDLGNRCAVMLDVIGTQRSAAQGVAPGALHARIILIKPRLIQAATVDVDEYQATHSAFPQETTMDQFFDEAQWESYRQLGMRCGSMVFTGNGTPGYPAALWNLVLAGLPVDD